MKYYLAPLEGITTYIYRNAYHSIFYPMDKYFSPFLVPRMKKSFNSREINDILPEHNQGLTVVPQLLTNCAEDFIKGVERLQEYDYQEFNLNLGCPSATVVSRRKGAGFLGYPLELERFLDQIFSKLSLKISIKTRIGMEDPQEFEQLLKIYNQFPLEELIIHPRLRQDFYKNKPNLLVFQQALTNSVNPICYNGDVFTCGDFEILNRQVSGILTVMLGRGILMQPWLCEELVDLKQETPHTVSSRRKELYVSPDLDQDKKQRLRQFHDLLYIGYQEIMSGDKNVLYKMKELWTYMIQSFLEPESYAKKIRKAETLRSYEIAVNSLFRERDITTIPSSMFHAAEYTKEK